MKPIFIELTLMDFEAFEELCLNTLSAGIILFAVIDILGSIPIVIALRENGSQISPLKISVVALVILLAFMFLGQGLLAFFGVDINSFAVAGAFVLFIIGVEMVLGLNLFKNDYNESASIVPMAFPLLAGPGTFTTILSLKADYSTAEIVAALFLNMVAVYFVLRSTRFIERAVGHGGIYVLKKFFGIIVLAISVKMFVSNLRILIAG